jgi:hypothetical protein
MKHSYLIFLLSFFLCASALAQGVSVRVLDNGTPSGHKEYYKPPSGKEHYVSPTGLDWSEVAASLTEGCRTDYEKLRSISRWMSRSITYDTSYSIHGADDCYRYRKGVCQAYCELFYRIASAAGIRVEIVSGITRDIWGNVQGGGHSWLFAYTRPDWGILIDPTWDAGSVSGGTFSFREHPGSWFAVDAEWMILRHFPEDESYQLLETPMNRSEFASLRGGAYLCADYGMDIHKIYLKARQGTLSMPRIYSEGEGEILSLDIPLRSSLTVGETYSFRVKLDTSREFVLSDALVHSVRSDEWTDEGDGVYSIRYTPQEERSVILGFREQLGERRWRTYICIAYDAVLL